MSGVMKPLREAFDERWIPEPNTGCWLWTGSIDKDGYGVLSRGAGKPQLKAHRVSVALSGRSIPPGMCACHKCDTPCCVNPNHIYVGTRAENNRDISLRARGWWLHSDPVERGSRAIPTVRRGSMNTRSKLTEAMVVEAIGLSEHMQGKDIAKHFGVARNTMYKALRGETWAHVHAALNGTKPEAAA